MFWFRKDSQHGVGVVVDYADTVSAWSFTAQKGPHSQWLTDMTIYDDNYADMDFTFGRPLSGIQGTIRQKS